jgi:hypothetical protein
MDTNPAKLFDDKAISSCCVEHCGEVQSRDRESVTYGCSEKGNKQPARRQ